VTAIPSPPTKTTTKTSTTTTATTTTGSCLFGCFVLLCGSCSLFHQQLLGVKVCRVRTSTIEEQVAK